MMLKFRFLLRIFRIIAELVILALLMLSLWILSSSRKGLNMVYLAPTKETKPPYSNLCLKITESYNLNKS